VSYRVACGPAEQQLTAASPWTTRRVQNHQLALPVSAVWRQAHQFTRPELVGEVAPLVRRHVRSFSV